MGRALRSRRYTGVNEYIRAGGYIPEEFAKHTIEEMGVNAQMFCQVLAPIVMRIGINIIAFETDEEVCINKQCVVRK